MAVFRRGNIWWYDFRFKGIRTRESTRAANRAEALHAEAIRKVELVQGKARFPKSEPSQRFVDFAYREFAPWCANEHKDRPSTFARYMRSVKALTQFLGDKPLDLIDSGMVERYKLQRSQQRRKNTRDGRRVTPAAVNRDLAVLRLLFNFAVRLGNAHRNPVTGIRFLPENNRHMRVLTAEEESRYLQAASPLLRDVAVVMLETGMRPGEVCRLRVEDVSLKYGSLHVRQGKTAYATRHVPLTQRALEVLVQRVSAAKN